MDVFITNLSRVRTILVYCTEYLYYIYTVYILRICHSLDTRGLRQVKTSYNLLERSPEIRVFQPPGDPVTEGRTHAVSGCVVGWMLVRRRRKQTKSAPKAYEVILNIDPKKKILVRVLLYGQLFTSIRPDIYVHWTFIPNGCPDEQEGPSPCESPALLLLSPPRCCCILLLWQPFIRERLRAPTSYFSRP